LQKMLSKGIPEKVLQWLRLDQGKKEGCRAPESGKEKAGKIGGGAKRKKVFNSNENC